MLALDGDAQYAVCRQIACRCRESWEIRGGTPTQARLHAATVYDQDGAHDRHPDGHSEHGSQGDGAMVVKAPPSQEERETEVHGFGELMGGVATLDPQLQKPLMYGRYFVTAAVLKVLPADDAVF